MACMLQQPKLSLKCALIFKYKVLIKSIPGHRAMLYELLYLCYWEYTSGCYFLFLMPIKSI